jgi:hypothetical protein
MLALHNLIIIFTTKTVLHFALSQSAQQINSGLMFTRLAFFPLRHVKTKPMLNYSIEAKYYPYILKSKNPLAHAIDTSTIKDPAICHNMNNIRATTVSPVSAIHR